MHRVIHVVREWTKPHGRRKRTRRPTKRHCRHAHLYRGKPVLKRERAQLPVTQALFPRYLYRDGAAASLRDAVNNRPNQRRRGGRAWSRRAWVSQA